MKLFYFASTVPNFGDELNPWLWPQLLPGIFDNQGDNALFIGIGTLLNGKLPYHVPSVVFGTGCTRGKLPPPFPASWKIYGVRGPLTARALGLPEEASLGDGAILLRTLPLAKVPVLHPLSFMPHFHSAILGKWPEVCRAAGIHFIDPTWPVETVLQEIRSSSQLITSAMHGAIVADALRIPWTPISPFSHGTCFKWQDWGESLDLKIKLTTLAASTPDEIIHDRSTRLRRLFQSAQRQLNPPPSAPPGRALAMISSPFVPAPIRKILTPGTIDRAARSLTAATTQPPCLSSDAAIDRVTTRLQERFATFRRDHAAGIFSSS